MGDGEEDEKNSSVVLRQELIGNQIIHLSLTIDHH